MNDETKTDATHPTKSAYLKEAMRLAELRIEEQHIRNTVLERKAALLVMFCSAVIGFLATAEFREFQNFFEFEELGKAFFWALKIIGIIFLGVATVCSITVFDLTNSIERGMDPEITLDPRYGYDYDNFTEWYLNNFKDIFKETKDALDKKAERLTPAYYCLFRGLGISFLLVLMNEIARISS